MNSSCVIGITGYSGSGKTTLIKKLLPELKKQGLSVGVLKHIYHNKLKIDVRGKDTDHFYRAGAAFVFAHDAQQCFARYRCSDKTFPDFIRSFPAALDLIIVEGHKDIDIPGIWLEKKTPTKKADKNDYSNRKVVFRDEPGYQQEVLKHIREELDRFHLSKRPLMSGLLIGGTSPCMGRPRALLKMSGKRLAEKAFNALSEISVRTVLLGTGQLPEILNTADLIPDVPGLNGPLAGMLSAFRWSPGSTWIISSVDMPLMHEDAWKWLLSRRKPGIWAILPRIRGSKEVETTGAVYEPMIFEYLESLATKGTAKLQEIAGHPKVSTPFIPKSLIPAWRNEFNGAVY
jgi:molybdopterin-guanine dinucleotide biosynthesis protein MobB